MDPGSSRVSAAHIGWRAQGDQGGAARGQGRGAERSLRVVEVGMFCRSGSDMRMWPRPLAASGCEGGVGRSKRGRPLRRATKQNLERRARHMQGPANELA